MSTQRIAPLPVCKAILLCERIVTDGSGKLSLLGLFNSFVVDDQLVARSAEAFCQITEAIGRYSVVAEVHDLFANEVIARSSPTDVEIDDPLMTTSVIISIPQLQFSNRELHDLVVFANGEEIDRKQFGVAAARSETHVGTT